MTPEAWSFFSVLTGSTFALLSETVRTRKKVEKASVAADIAANKASIAADAAKPMGNGFAASVLTSLAEQKESMRELHHEIRDVKAEISEHKSDHIKLGRR